MLTKGGGVIELAASGFRVILVTFLLCTVHLHIYVSVCLAFSIICLQMSSQTTCL